MSWPILRGHDALQPLGRVSVDGHRLTFKLERPVSREELFDIFGGAGLSITRMDMINDTALIYEGEILEFSACGRSL